MTLVLDKTFTVEALPRVDGPYQCSKPLLGFTTYGSYILCTFRYNFLDIGMFDTGFNGKEYFVHEVVWWAELDNKGGMV